MPVKLILSDIDSTILPKGAERVSEATVAAFHEAMDAGIHVGPATGRAVEWLGGMFGGDDACYQTCVATNGNQVWLDGDRFREAQITPQLIARIIEVLADFPGAGVIYFDGRQPVLASGTRQDLLASFPAYGQACRTSEDGSALGLPEGPRVKVNVFVTEGGHAASEDATRTVIARLNDQVEGLDFDFPQPGFSNVMPAGWSKASGIGALVERLGISWDEVVVFGDAGNDLAMFAKVPNSVAVANATEEAAASARWHIGACQDDAVAHAISALARGEWPFDR